MTLLKDLIDIPERLGKGDFVFTLEDAIENPEQVLGSYVVTPQLQESFDDALDQIEGALRSKESRASYLHGSFGSGKSHFMAVLYLLLSHVPEARAVPELQKCVAEHDDWLAGKNFLLIPVHMINADVERLEEAIISAYVERVEALHPEAGLPAVYQSAPVFENADDLQRRLGESAFFEALNVGSPGAGSGLGKLAGPRWDAETYEAAKAGKPGNADHDGLVSALVSPGSLLSSYSEVARGEKYVSLEEGLSAMSRHAKELGYDGLILFLDELILWLATRMADLNWVQREGQKMATLREAPLADRPIPIASFIARQRDLRELVGEHYPGSEKQTFHDALSYSEGRFHTITLEDRNLRAIAERRVLAPKNEEAKQAIDQAFAETLKAGDKVLEVLLGPTASEEEFRASYPFSPAFIDTLVAASSALQRERTAIRVMVQLLSDRRDEIELGDVIPVGDLFDVLRGADEPFSQEMKQQFKEAQALYENRLRPLVLAHHGIEVDEGVTVSLPPAAAADDRLIKTLLLAALIYDAEPLRGLTASRLVALNHGTIATPIPGEERTTALASLKRLRGSVGQLKIQDGADDPTVSIELAGVDTDAIINAARTEHDSPGARRRLVRDFIREQLGLGSAEGLFTVFGLTWNGIDRELEIAVENVRELRPENAVAHGHNWKVIVDYPFDSEGSGRNDDLAQIEALQDGIERSKTVFWLPAFVTREVQRDLGNLVTIEALLLGDRLTGHTPNLSAVDREKARGILESQRSQLQSSVREAFEQAYGISNPKPETIEGGERASFDSLDPGLSIQQPVGTDLKSALEQLASQLLRHQYPAHPELADRVTAGKVRKVWELVLRALEHPNGRLDDLDPGERRLLKEIATPLELGTMHEGPFVLGKEWRERFTKAMGRHGIDEPSVRELRSWIDEPDPRGLPPDLERLIILAFATEANRSFQLHGGAAPVADPSAVSDDFKLVEVELPSEKEWKVAKDRAAAIFGVAMSDLKTAQNLDRHGEQIREKAASLRDSIRSLRTHTEGTLEPTLGIPRGESDRSVSTREAEALIETLTTVDDAEIIPGLASAYLSCTPQDIASTLKQADSVAEALSNANWGLIGALKDRASSEQDAEAALARLVEAAKASELVTPLRDALDAATKAATEVVTKGAKPAPAPRKGQERFEGLSVGRAKELLDGLEHPERTTVDLVIMRTESEANE